MPLGRWRGPGITPEVSCCHLMRGRQEIRKRTIRPRQGLRGSQLVGKQRGHRSALWVLDGVLYALGCFGLRLFGERSDEEIEMRKQVFAVRRVNGAKLAEARRKVALLHGHGGEAQLAIEISGVKPQLGPELLCGPLGFSQ